jgi:ribosomal protein L31E
MMALIEQTYTIPLRKEYQKAPKYRRAKKAINAVRAFVQKHMKTEEVLIGPKLNLKIWEHGIKNPPHHVKVTAIRDDKEGLTRVELFGFEFKKQEKKEKKEKPKGMAGKLQETLGTKEEGPKTEVTTKKDIKEVKKGVEKKPAEEKEEPKVEEAKKPEADEKEAKPKAEEKPVEKKEEPKAPAEAKPAEKKE